MIDLHVHTTSSDGQYTTTEIIQKAAEKKTNDQLREAVDAVKKISFEV